MGSVLPIHKTNVKSSVIPRSLQTKRIIPLIFLCLLLFYLFRSSTHYITHSDLSTVDSIDYKINPLYWAPALSDRTRASAYPRDYFTHAALWENELKPISAVILRVEDDDSIVYTVKHLLKYHFIREIHIYNTVKYRPLTVKVRY
ncbi:hypothetical protein BDB01DRAFT_331442 [Pilobolus umbonatus]|nr:hypothetical protein BDB01DRAFT_331442 [Pilobolus umbonatus]